MKSNGLIKWLMLPALLVLIFVMLKSCSGDKSSSNAPSPNAHLSPDEMKRLGIEGDTPMDTVATLVGQTKAMREELKSLLDVNKTQKEEVDRLRLRESDVDKRIRTTLEGQLEELKDDRQKFNEEKQTTRSLLDHLKQQLDTRALMPGNADLPVGLGLQPGDGDAFKKTDDSLIWIDPQDGTAIDAQGKPIPSGSNKPSQGFNFPSAFADQINMGQRELKANAGAAGRNIKTDEKAQARPVYTLPENSTLMGSVAMTALIGRVPVDGKVNDPFPFKILIGPDNLTANGIDLPDVAGAIISGTAAGDWTLSCVRGQIVSMTFVFNDGRVRTLPQPQQLTTRQGNNQSSGQMDKIQGGIGWISDPNGIPCISGDRRSNAQQYIGSKSLITAAGAGVAKLLEAEQASTGTVISSNGTTIGTANGAGNSALSRILSGGVKDIGDWVNKLYGQAFAAIYVQPGAKVAVHLDRQLEIDYEPDGRKVKYLSGGAHASSLD